jgi:hypothetical protein
MMRARTRLEALRQRLGAALAGPTLDHSRQPLLSFSPYQPPTLAAPTSQLCTADQLDEPAYPAWCAAIGEAPKTHRKQWEFVYILSVLEHLGMIAEGRTGLGFGCGLEPLPAALAARGCRIVATDMDPSGAAEKGWTNGQHARALDDLNAWGLCPPEAFAARVTFRVVDMNAVPRDLDGRFDFCWSACAFEHLGSIDKGLDFFVRSLDCLRPGGVAVHTTEFNLSSDDDTVDHANTVIFRRRDLERLARRLVAAGHTVLPLNFNVGDRALDRHLDVAPYRPDRHLRLRLGRYAATSVGLVALRGAD